MGQTQTNPSPPGTLAWGPMLDLSGQRPGPLHERLTRALRGAIRDGRLPRGAVLPPSRDLASDLGVSRWAVTRAYGQLVTEGYLTSRTGSATRVLWSPEPDRDREPHRDPAQQAAPTAPARYDLSPCASDLRAFPRRKWVEAIRLAAETTPFDQLGYAAPGGEPRLRALLAEQLTRTRGADLDPAMMSVFAGAKQAMANVCRALYLAGYRVIGCENPGSTVMWQAAQSAGLELVALPADSGGLVTDALASQPRLRAVFTGAAHQIMFGGPLAPERRSALLDWARRADGLIIEDDYDAEFSYDHLTPPVMQGSDRRHVVLLGSMSRTLSPTISVGWAVAPPPWVEPVRAAYQPVVAPPALTQIALASFIESGAYGRHLRASKLRFRRRRDALLSALHSELPQYPVTGAESGLHVLLELPEGTSVTAIVNAAHRNDMALSEPAELYIEGGPEHAWLQIGYGNLNDSEVDAAVATLAKLLTS